MRLLALVLVLAVPLAAGEPAPTLRQCTSSGCVVATDADGDGVYDWANAAFIVGEQVVANVNANGSRALFELAVTSEELGGHEAEDLAGLETHHTVALVGSADLTHGAREADALLFVGEADHETGETRTLAWRYVVARDTDGDGAPDRVETVP